MATVLLVRMAITANNFGLSWVYRSETPLDHRLRRLAVARLFLQEYRASMISSSWTMGFCTFRDRPGTAGTLPVLLVHGYGCNSGYWHSMSRALSCAGIGHYGICTGWGATGTWYIEGELPAWIHTRFRW